MTHRASAFTLAAGVVPLLVAAAGCGGTESTASRSAAAYDDAQRKGVPVGQSAHAAREGHGDGEHAAEPSAPKAAVSPAIPAMDHSSMPTMRTPGTGSQAAPRADAHAGMDHSTMPGMSGDMQMPPASPEPLSASAKSGQPAATLHPDPLDEALSTAIADAARSAAMAAEMSGGSHTMSHGTYRHVDAGRDSAAPSPKPSPHQEHKH